MTLFFNSHEITIYRSRRKTGTDRYGMSATLTVYSADIQPASIERTQSVQGRIGNIFDAFVDSSVDIKEGDQVVSDGKRYAVRGISLWENAGLLQHKELTLEAQDGGN